MYISDTDFSKLGFPEGVGTTSYPKLTKDFLSMVNLTLISLPALLGGFYIACHKKDEEKKEESQQINEVKS